MKALTWNTYFNIGSVIKDDTLVIPLAIKPTLSFSFTNLYYEEVHQRFDIDGNMMSDSQKQECVAFIDACAIPVPNSNLILKTDAEKLSYAAVEFLKATDWYFVRQIEKNVPIPAGIIEKRAQARALVLPNDSMGMYNPALSEAEQEGVTFETMLQILKHKTCPTCP